LGLLSEMIEHPTEGVLGCLQHLLLRFVAELTTFTILAEPSGAEIVAELGLVVATTMLLLSDLHTTVCEGALHFNSSTASLKGHSPVAVQ